MTVPQKPATRPENPRFSPGPTTKFKGWSFDLLKNALLGRSHRSKDAVERMQYLLSLTREVLQVPDDYLIGIVPGSDTGAVEMAMWNLLGARPVQVLAWESFGKMWVSDVLDYLKLEQAEARVADFGELPDLASVDFSHDVVFTWNGTTSGARVPDGDWIPADREGLTICDATSAAFAQELPFDKLDVVTYSWQKVMGGEAQHGILILSPRAVERLESHTPPWPLPKLFRLTKDGKLIKGIFEGKTINTVSLMAIEDHIVALQWAKELGGLPALIAKANENAQTVWDWEARTDWVENLVADPAIRSNTSVCMRLSEKGKEGLTQEQAKALPARMLELLAEEGAGYDLSAYRTAPPGFRIWCGATVEKSDIEALLPWLDWAYATARAELTS